MANPIEDQGAYRLRAVTPAAADLPLGVCRALWIGSEGDVEILAEHDSAPVIIASVAAGTLLPIRARRVLADNTGASDIVALY